MSKKRRQKERRQCDCREKECRQEHHRKTCSQDETQKKDLSEETDSRKERIELIKHITVLCFGASAGAYIILGITIAKNEPSEVLVVGSTLVRVFPDFLISGGREFLLLTALASFLMAILAGVAAFSDHIRKGAIEFYDIKERYMIWLFAVGFSMLFFYIIVISWLVAAMTCTIAVAFVSYQKFHNHKYQFGISLAISLIFFALFFCIAVAIELAIIFMADNGHKSTNLK